MSTKLWGSGRAPFIASALALMSFIAVEWYAITTVLPVVMSDLDALEWYSLAFSATLTASLVGMVVSGNWADRSGPRTPLIVGGSLFIAGIALCVVAPNAGIFIVGRFLQGLGGGGNSVLLYVLIARQIPQEHRPNMFGLLSAAWLLPSMLGPLVAGWLTEALSWRTVFAFILVGTVVALLSVLRSTRSVRRAVIEEAREAGRPRLIGRRGRWSMVAGVLLLVLHFTGQLPPPYSYAVTAALLIVLVVAARFLLPRGTLCLRPVPSRMVALRGILGAAVTGVELYLTLYLQTERGFSATVAGLVIAISAIGWALGAWIQGRFPSAYRSHRRLVIVAAPLVLIGPVVILLYTYERVPTAVVVAACVVMGGGMGLAYPRMTEATLSLVSSGEHGLYSSSLQASESLASAAVTAIMSVVLIAVVVTHDAFAIVFTGLSICALGAVWIAASSPRRLDLSAGFPHGS